MVKSSFPSLPFNQVWPVTKFWLPGSKQRSHVWLLRSVLNRREVWPPSFLPPASFQVDNKCDSMCWSILLGLWGKKPCIDNRKKTSKSSWNCLRLMISRLLLCTWEEKNVILLATLASWVFSQSNLIWIAILSYIHHLSFLHSSMISELHCFLHITYGHGFISHSYHILKIPLTPYRLNSTSERSSLRYGEK